MRKSVATGIALLCTVVALLWSGSVARADSPVGRWSGSFSGVRGGSSASATFRSDGSCTLTALGISASGSYGGGRIHVSGYGYSMSLSYSVSGDSMTIRGSKGGYSGVMKLSRKSGGGSGTGTSGDDAEVAAREESPFGRWSAEADGVQYDVSLYEDGFLYWLEAPNEGGIEPMAFGALLTVEGNKLTLRPLGDEVSADAPALWAETADGTEVAWIFTYQQEGDVLVLSNGDKTLLTLSRAGDAEKAPAEALFRPYITLEKGDQGEAVRQLQEALIEVKYLDGEADGIFGSKTRAAVKSFQSAQGLEADGIARPEVLIALYGQAEE